MLIKFKICHLISKMVKCYQLSHCLSVKPSKKSVKRISFYVSLHILMHNENQNVSHL